MSNMIQKAKTFQPEPRMSFLEEILDLHGGSQEQEDEMIEVPKAPKLRPMPDPVTQ